VNSSKHDYAWRHDNWLYCKCQIHAVFIIAFRVEFEKKNFRPTLHIKVMYNAYTTLGLRDTGVADRAKCMGGTLLFLIEMNIKNFTVYKAVISRFQAVTHVSDQERLNAKNRSIVDSIQLWGLDIKIYRGYHEASLPQLLSEA